MASSLSDLRKNRGNFDSLRKEVEKIATPYADKDEGFWKPTTDKMGNAQAVIRFLPPPKGEELPWVRRWDHGFQGPTGKWYIENSLTTLGQSDPVSELNSELWNSGVDANKEIARKQKRRLSYYANILVVKDPANKENEGKVFLFKFGKKIFDKIKDVMQPQFEDETPINPFDFWAGANFKLKVQKVEGYPNYDKSAFEGPSEISADDAVIEAIWEQQKPLQDLVAPKNFKTYEELSKKLKQVLNGTVQTSAEKVAAERMADEPAEEAPKQRTAAPKAAKAAPAKAAEADDEEDTLAYFAGLADDE